MIAHLVVVANARACFCIVAHSSAALLLMKIIFCETNNSLANKNYLKLAKFNTRF